MPGIILAGFTQGGWFASGEWYRGNRVTQLNQRDPLPFSTFRSLMYQWPVKPFCLGHGMSTFIGVLKLKLEHCCVFNRIPCGLVESQSQGFSPLFKARFANPYLPAPNLHDEGIESGPLVPAAVQNTLSTTVLCSPSFGFHFRRYAVRWPGYLLQTPPLSRSRPDTSHPTSPTCPS